MTRRFLAFVGLAAAMAIVSLATVPITGQAPTAAAPAGAVDKVTFRTPWGEPDLQGTWSYATVTPLQRPEIHAGREFLTPEELAAVNDEARTGADRRDGPRGADIERAYNAFWWDKGMSTGRTSLIVDPADGKLPPLTPEGQKRQAEAAAYRRAHPADSWEDRPLQERCITYQRVPPIPSGYNNTFQIFQTPGLVAILNENIHDARIIPLDGRPHINGRIRQWNGDARGHWEGNTLIVETTNFSPKTTWRGFPGAGETLRSVERFTRVGADTIDYQFTIHDPATYTRPWTVKLPLTNVPDYVIYEYACHEANYSIVNVLGGARVQEKLAEEAAKGGTSAAPQR